MSSKINRHLIKFETLEFDLLSSLMKILLFLFWSTHCNKQQCQPKKLLKQHQTILIHHFSRIMKFTCKIWAFVIPGLILITNCERTKNVSLSVAPSISRQKIIILTVSATTYHHKIIQGNWPLTPTILLFTSS